MESPVFPEIIERAQELSAMSLFVRAGINAPEIIRECDSLASCLDVLCIRLALEEGYNTREAQGALGVRLTSQLHRVSEIIAYA